MSSQEHCNLAAVRKRFEHALAFASSETSIESEKPSKLVAVAPAVRTISIVRDSEAGMHHFVFHSRLRHAASVRP